MIAISRHKRSSDLGAALIEYMPLVSFITLVVLAAIPPLSSEITQVIGRVGLQMTDCDVMTVNTYLENTRGYEIVCRDEFFDTNGLARYRLINTGVYIKSLPDALQLMGDWNNNR